ncbi:MAG TPA: hypothetical protein VEO58_13575 [Gemmatimonadales bacterium]|jgi:hypothetical protein|nr:hypothetical protein [Gemmatimonadales bacterium]
MPRSRDRVLGNLESIYREAYERAKAASDQVRMADLDAAYQREQLLLEVLLDIRDALAALPASAESGSGKTAGSDPIAALETIHRITKLR